MHAQRLLTVARLALIFFSLCTSLGAPLASAAPVRVPLAAPFAANITTTFNVNATTVWGENVFVVGSLPALGSWDPVQAIALASTNYPVWSATVTLPSDTVVEYKFIKKNGTTVTWESTPNRTFTTPASGSVTRNDTWGTLATATPSIATSTNTPLPPTNTNTPPATATPLPATATPLPATATPLPPTATATTSGAQVGVTFNVNATTVTGESVFVVGSIPALGSWDTTKAITLSSATYPVWSALISLPASTAVEYKYIKKNGSTVTWEGNANRAFTTPASGSATRNDTWGTLATATAASATNTATRTNTPLPPSNTPTSTSTPLPPPNTATRTNTPLPGTATASATASCACFTNTPPATATSLPPTPNSAITFNPANPLPGGNVTLIYNGTLKASTVVTLHWGVNHYATGAIDTRMVKQTNGTWELTITVPATATNSLDAVFYNGATWDNNSGADYHATLGGPSPTPTASRTPGPTYTPATATPLPPTRTPGPPTSTPAPYPRTDFRKETIYFVIITRFYDGDSSNNTYTSEDYTAHNDLYNDPSWRGDFKGLIEKLDYIKALGFSAIWITPVVKNRSGYDYHGYHAYNFSEVDPRYESAGIAYQDFINAAHAKGLKVIQDIVVNHTSNWGEENLYPVDQKLVQYAYLFSKPYDQMTPAEQYQARLRLMKESDTNNDVYHTEKSLTWEGYTVQTGQIAGDCVDLNTENPVVDQYLINAYNQYIDMGVDGFRVDTVKHVSRLMFNKYFLPAFQQRGGPNFYMFGEVAARYRDVWNSGIPAISVPFYTWKETQSYPQPNPTAVYQHWQDNSTVSGEPESNNHYLIGNSYHTPDWSLRSGLDEIDFPMHWAFRTAGEAFAMKYGDKFYNDATWNVTYVDSHDYAPDGAPENQRFAGSQATWAENLSLMFTFRGIPTVFYGSEIEFQKGKPIDVGPNAPLKDTGRAYYGDYLQGTVTTTDYGQYTATGTVANTLNYPLAKHIRRLNQIRRAIPALQLGQYSTDDVAGGMAFKRRYTAGGVDSFALVALSGSATFYNLPGGTYTDAITGQSITIANGGSLTANVSGQGNLRVFVLNGPGKIGADTEYLHP